MEAGQRCWLLASGFMLCFLSVYAAGQVLGKCAVAGHTILGSCSNGCMCGDNTVNTNGLGMYTLEICWAVLYAAKVVAVENLYIQQAHVNGICINPSSCTCLQRLIGFLYHAM
jgi:hypothetical protein